MKLLPPTLIALFLAGSTHAASILGNGGFEIVPTAQPVYSFGSLIGQYHQSDVDTWNTTASDGLIELWNDGAQGVDAYEGNTYAEVNATEEASLFQEVTLTAGLSVDYTFAHRGRAGTDTLRFTIIDLGANGVFDGFDNNGDAQGDDVIVVDRTSSADNSEWMIHYGNDVFVSENSTYRFNYEAVSTATGDQSIGNFLDAFASGENIADEYIGEGSIVAPTAPVPEPSSSLLLAVSSFALMFRKRA